MKRIALTILAAAIQCVTLSSNAANSNFKIVCHVQDYLCYPGTKKSCAWGTVLGHEKEFNLVKNPSYPNPSYPNEVWEGALTDTLHYSQDPSQYKLKVQVVVNPKGEKSYSTSLEYRWKTWTAFGQGVAAVGAGLVDQTLVDKEHFAGRGYYCWGAEFTR
jgi:hypothetical protein